VENAGLTAETWDAEAGSFTYDANGNLTSAPEPYSVSAVTYDPANLPLSITRSGVTSNYRYDDAGQRITKQVGAGNTEVYLREGATVLGVFTMSGGTVASSYFNILWEDRVVGRHTSADVRSYYHFDPLGSVRAVVSNTGAMVESSDFDPWGLAMPGRALVNATPVKERFSGKERDSETGLDYFGARYYMPALGRWAAVDPSADAMLEWSPYNYVYDNAVGQVDPDGRQARSAGAVPGGSLDPALRLPRLPPPHPGQFAGLAAQGIIVGELLGAGAVASFTPLDGPVNTGIDILTGNFSVLGTVLNFVPGPGGSKVDDVVEGVADATRTGTYRELRQEGVRDAHHVIQHAAVRDLPGYSREAAPAVHLPGPVTTPGTAHYNATRVQRQAGGGTYGAERRIGYKALRAAGIDPKTARAVMTKADASFAKINVTRQTCTRLPGNRGC
jgi:RHS repeat-associated protein